MANGKWPPTYVEGFHIEESIRQTEYRKLGATDMFVSKLSLGGGPFGNLYTNCDQETTTRIVVESLKNGINFIDTSSWYGQGKSEDALGVTLQNVPRSSYYIATKIGRYDKEYKNMFDFSAERTRRQLDIALQRLKLPYVDIIHVHDVEFCENESIILNETLPTLLKAKESGKARYIGITGYDLDVLKSIVEKSKIPIDVILTYSRSTLHDSSLRYYIPYFKDKNIGIINAAPMSMGLLTDQGPPNWHPASERIKMACHAAVEYCRHKLIDISKLGAHESVNFPGVATTLVGMDSVPQVEKNLKASWGYLSDEERRCLNDIMNKYFLPLNDENWGDEALKFYKTQLKQDDGSTWT